MKEAWDTAVMATDAGNGEVESGFGIEKQYTGIAEEHQNPTYRSTNPAQRKVLTQIPQVSKETAKWKERHNREYGQTENIITFNILYDMPNQSLLMKQRQVKVSWRNFIVHVITFRKFFPRL
ncbi:hypothetical protein PR048_011141 [Dryococelus australis]|uniref:Uncharacterized protein n=1 Tax=Dryococelus australis TaxID=614101 RepID=A0ABQ9HKZ0_9NEOP|nr:hypothetical protein PR048_011141 [Dryococelus australis]